ncbi:MAG: nucleotide exchange factor GrpE [Bacteroidota bacterium]
MDKILKRKLLKLWSELQGEETFKKLSQENRRIKRLKGLFFKNFPKGNQVFKKIWEEIMDDSKQPLRASDKLKGLYNTFLRNDDQKRTKMSDTNNEDQETVENQNEQDQDNGQNDELATLKAERDELRDQVLRKSAEVENIRRRAQKEKQDLIEYANERLLGNLVHVLDDLYMALEAAKKSTDYDALLKGIEMVYTKAQKAFEQAGVKPIVDHIGKPFDVNYHEALMHMPSEEPEGNVVQEVQRGYMLRDKVLRHAKVITSAGQGE